MLLSPQVEMSRWGHPVVIISSLLLYQIMVRKSDYYGHTIMRLQLANVLLDKGWINAILDWESFAIVAQEQDLNYPGTDDTLFNIKFTGLMNPFGIHDPDMDQWPLGPHRHLPTRRMRQLLQLSCGYEPE